MNKIFLLIVLATISVLSKPVTFKDHGAIWLCDNGYGVWAEQNAQEVNLTNDKKKINQTLKYDIKKDMYLSKDGKYSLQFKGKSLNDSKIIFIINKKAYSCYYEYIERG